jgi:hypothetical protein
MYDMNTSSYMGFVNLGILDGGGYSIGLGKSIWRAEIRGQRDDCSVSISIMEFVLGVSRIGIMRSTLDYRRSVSGNA